MAGRIGDPYSGFNFVVDLGLGNGNEPAAAFRRVRGLGASIDVVEYRVGNDRENHVRKLPGLRHYSDVTLKRGLIGDLSLWEWINSDPPDRRLVTITMLDAQRAPVLRFALQQAWPRAWNGPTLRASGSEVAIEELVLCHERLDVDVA